MSAKREMTAIAAYTALAVLATYPLAWNAGSAIPQGGDSWSNYWNLWWIKTALVDRGASPYFAPDLHFPYGASLYLHTLNLLGGLLALPIVLVLGLAAGYNVLVFLSFVLSGYGAYRLALYVMAQRVRTQEPEPDSPICAICVICGGDIRAVCGHPLCTICGPVRMASFIAGISFAFSSYRYAHLLGHLDLVSTQWLPFSALFLLKARDEGGWRNIVLAALFLAAATLTTLYYMLFVLLFAGYLLIERLVTSGRDSWPQARRICAALAVFLIAISPVLVPMLVMGRTEGRAPDVPQDLERFSADALAFIVPSPLSPLWGDAVAPIYRAIAPDAYLETVAYLGVVPLALAVFGMKSCREAKRFWLPALVLFALLALGPVVHIAGHALLPWLTPVMPYSLLARLPYGDIPRVPARFVVMAMLCLSVMAGVGAWSVMRRLTEGLQLTTALVIIVLAIAENVVVPLPLMTVSQPSAFVQIRNDPRLAGILEVPIQDDRPDIPERMLFQTVHEKPIYGGYVSRARPLLPFSAVPGFAQFATLSDVVDDVVVYDEAALPAISRAALRFYDAGYVAIETKFMNADSVERGRHIADRLLGSSSRVSEDDGMWTYAVSPHAAATPAAVWLDTGWSYLERLPDSGPDGRPLRWRWMGEQARLGVVVPEPTRVRLRLVAQAFGRVRRLQLAWNGSPIATMPIGQDRASYETPPFQLTPDVRLLELRSLDGAETPGVDKRRLSVALYRLELVID